MNAATRTGERGSGTVLMLSVVGIACLALLIAAGAGHVWIASRQVLAMADTAAVSAASALRYGTGDPCPVANRIISAEGGTMASCVIDGEDVTVTAIRRIGGQLDMTISKTSRAGPVVCR